MDRKDQVSQKSKNPDVAEFLRQQTARSMLNLSWDTPVYKPLHEREENKGSRYAWTDKGRLDRERAVYEIAGDDRRPLLVMRECTLCKGPGVWWGALLQPSATSKISIGPGAPGNNSLAFS